MNEYFWGHVLGSSNKAKGFDLIFHHFLASTHVDQLQIAVPADHDVFRLEITVDYSLLMEGLQHMDQQRYVEPSLLQR